MIKVGALGTNTYSSEQLAYISPVNVGGIKSLATPYVSGQSFILFTYIPPQIQEVTDMSVIEGEGSIPDTKFFDLMERTFQEVSGINDISLETEAMTGGFTAINHNFPSSATSSTESITLNFQAMSGNLYRAPIQAWLTGIRDPRTGLFSLPTYGGVHEYSVDMLYLNANPSVGAKNGETRRLSLEFAAIFDSMYPKTVPLSHFNYSKATHSMTELSLEFNCDMIMGDNIDLIAGNVLGSKWFYDQYILPAKKYHANRKNSGVLKIGENDTSEVDAHNGDSEGYNFLIIDDTADIGVTAFAKNVT